MDRADGGVATEAGLRAATEDVCAQLCAVVAGDFDVRVRTDSEDETAQKLVLLANFVLDAARRAAEASKVARLGSWRKDLLSGTFTMSEAMHELLGTEPATFEPTPQTLRALVHPDDREAVAATFSAATEQPLDARHEWRVLRADGGIAWLWTETRAELDAAGCVIAVRGVCQDVTERRAAADRIYKLAHHDPLTDLANRTLLQDRLTDAVRRARRGQGHFALHAINLDGFKAINDLHGHAIGDSLLREVAARLRRTVRAGDTLARLSGDEFVVLQETMAEPGAARTLADRLLALLAQPHKLGAGRDAEALITASIGIALFPAHGETAEILLRNADTALHHAKHAGKNSVAYFLPEMDRALRERRMLERDLAQAIARREFTLAWQPLAQAREGGAVTGFEVLLRWQHAERGTVPPDLFIPVAEGAGLIGAIGEWVLREACMEAAGWPNTLRIAVNVSPLQAQQGEPFAQMVEQALSDSGLAASRLDLEVTEGVLIRNADRVLKALRRLKAAGVRFSLDDFGTGYSSLATLRTFPFDKLKIDKTFVCGVANGGQDGAIVRAVLGLARGLGLPVVAEGVETEVQRRALAAGGCEEVQGWLIGRPAPIASFRHLTGIHAPAALPAPS